MTMMCWIGRSGPDAGQARVLCGSAPIPKAQAARSGAGSTSRVHAAGPLGSKGAIASSHEAMPGSSERPANERNVRAFTFMVPNMRRR